MHAVQNGLTAGWCLSCDYRRRFARRSSMMRCPLSRAAERERRYLPDWLWLSPRLLPSSGSWESRESVSPVPDVEQLVDEATLRWREIGEELRTLSSGTNRQTDRQTSIRTGKPTCALILLSTTFCCTSIVVANDDTLYICRRLSLFSASCLPSVSSCCDHCFFLLVSWLFSLLNCWHCRNSVGQHEKYSK